MDGQQNMEREMAFVQNLGHAAPDATTRCYPDVERVTLNVGGTRHQIARAALASSPGHTRLGQLARSPGLGAETAEIFFDRHPGFFNAVIEYCRSGELHVPADVCSSTVKRELEFWGIDNTEIASCCRARYSACVRNQNILENLNRKSDHEDANIDPNLNNMRRTQLFVWKILDCPKSSRLAMVYAVVSFLFVLASIAVFLAETFPDFHKKTKDGSGEVTDILRYPCYVKSNRIFSALDYLFAAVFTIEVFARIFCAPNKKMYLCSPLNIVDILALIPFYVQICVPPGTQALCTYTALRLIFFLRVVRIFRVLHLLKHRKEVQVLCHTVRASLREVLLLLVLFSIATLLFSTLFFLAENNNVHTDYESISVSFWFTVVALTTVGYGDVLPRTHLGRVCAALCALSGIFILSLIIPIFARNFALIYAHVRSRDYLVVRKQKKPRYTTGGKLTSGTT